MKETKEKLMKKRILSYQLFFGKVSELIGQEKAMKLLNESKKQIENNLQIYK